MAVERVFIRTGRRTRTVPSLAVILQAAQQLRALHPAHHFKLHAALAWRFGISSGAIRKALKAARR